MQLNEALGSLLNVNVADVLAAVPVGPDALSVVFGATVSTVIVRLATAPVLPVASVALTSKVWGPSPRVV